MQIRHGIPPLQAALDHGIQPSLSVDVECNMTADMFSITRAAFTLQRALANERSLAGEQNIPPLLTCRQVIEMATIGGAKVAHLDRKIGTISPGKEVDIIMLAADRINVFPLNNVPGTVVTLMDTSNVETVLVAGKIVKWQGKPVGVDLGRLIEKSRDASSQGPAIRLICLVPAAPLEEVRQACSACRGEHGSDALGGQRAVLIQGAARGRVLPIDWTPQPAGIRLSARRRHQRKGYEMKAARISGTENYADEAPELLKRYESISFGDAHARVLHLIPPAPCRVLDIGAGTGRDAAGFVTRGHSVVAVEPTEELRRGAMRLHPSPMIEWLDDSLPDLAAVRARSEEFDVVMLTAVWMHLDEVQRQMAMPNVAALVRNGAIVIMSLRHGPVPPGRRMFEVSAEETIALAQRSNLCCTLNQEAESSLRRPGVTWTRLAFQKVPGNR
jgi:protein-L-isoaspartate O-methyltransferase